jgi:hypothetical protein
MMESGLAGTLTLYNHLSWSQMPPQLRDAGARQFVTPELSLLSSRYLRMQQPESTFRRVIITT